MRLALCSSLTVLVALTFCQVSMAGAVFSSSSLTAAKTFQDALGSTTMTLAWDGANYWAVTGGNTGGVREAEYSPSFAVLGTFSPGLDFRSISPDAAGVLYSRTYASPTIYKQTAPGVFASFATLGGTFLSAFDGAQVGIVLNGAKTEYVGQLSGTIGRWSLSGSFIGTVPLTGYGSVTGETSYPQDCRVATVGPYYLTYANGTLSAWDASGNRVDQTTLVGAGSTFDSYFSISYANGYAWVVDVAGGTWRGYPVAASIVPVPVSVPALSGWGLGLAIVLLLGTATLALRRDPARG